MRKILTVAGLLLALGSLALSPLVHAEEEAAPAAKPDTAKADAGKKEEGGDKGKKPDGVSGGRFAGDPVYVHIAPMVLPVISDAGVEQLVTIVIDVEVRDFDVADNLHSNMPKVMDALMRGLYGGLGQGSLRNGKLVDVTKVKNKATAALQTIIGDDGIKNVLVQGVSQRML
jgi:flagellar basal body-associated protein FliL